MREIPWKERRYIRGLRCKNAGISLSTAELAFLDSEAKAISSQIHRRFTRTALVRFVLEKHYGDEWADMMLDARQSAISKLAPSGSRKNPPGVRGRPRGNATTTSSNTSVTNTKDHDTADPDPEPVPAT